jgi:hypothetical protein
MADLHCDSISRVYRLPIIFIVISEEFLSRRDDDARRASHVVLDEALAWAPKGAVACLASGEVREIFFAPDAKGATE